VIRLKWLVAVAACCLVFPLGSASACQYNVREVGFIDLGIEPYRLAVYLPQDVPAEGVSGLKDAMEVALAETNIRFEPVLAAVDTNHPALKIARTHGISRFPAAVLVSPDGQSMPLDVSRASSPRSEGGTPSTQVSLAEAVPAALAGVLESPTRRQILEKCADAYGVVLLIEGPEPQANATAKKAVAAAVQHIGDHLEFLPKPIKNPPEMVVLDQKSLEREQVLLWTFRLKPEDVNRPHAAVFYGRGRWIGPLFEGEVLTADNLVQLLGIIGADCECGLDHRWLQGTMLPARWDAALQQRAVTSLGFDPESPMIKMEIISILRRGMGGFAQAAMPLEYREIEIGGAAEDEEVTFEEDADKPQGPARSEEVGGVGLAPPKSLSREEPVGQSPPHGLPSSPEMPPGFIPQKPGAAASAPLPAQETPASQPRPALVGQVLAGSLAGMALLVGLTSMIIVLRARRP